MIAYVLKTNEVGIYIDQSEGEYDELSGCFVGAYDGNNYYADHWSTSSVEITNTAIREANECGCKYLGMRSAV